MAVLETCITTKQLVNKQKQHIYIYVCMYRYKGIFLKIRGTFLKQGLVLNCRPSAVRCGSAHAQDHTCVH